jgi:hypothetical protein
MKRFLEVITLIGIVIGAIGFLLLILFYINLYLKIT